MREFDAVCPWPLLRMPDGRVYAYQNPRVYDHGDSPEVLRAVSIEVIQKNVEYSYWEFYFNFYKSGFERRRFTDDAKCLLNIARRWIERYFETHHRLRPRHTWGRPIVVDCR